MTKEQILQRIGLRLCDHLAVDAEQITASAGFIDDLGADSLDLVEIVMIAEEEFDIAIDDEKAEGVVTVGDLVDVIAEELMVTA